MKFQKSEKLFKCAVLKIAEWNNFVFNTHDDINSPTPNINVSESNQILIFLTCVNEANRVPEDVTCQCQCY